MKQKLSLMALGLACILLPACQKNSIAQDDSDYVSVQREDSKMWSLLDVGSGEIVVTDEFFAPASRVVKGAFFVENDKGEFDLYKLQDTRNQLNRNSYSVVSNFNPDGFAIVRVKDEPWQIIDVEGNTIATLDKTFEILSGFSKEGMAKFMNKDGMIGYVNTKGEIPIKPRYKFGTIYSDGIAFVLTKQENDHNYFAAIDPAGNTVFTFSDAKYSDIGLFTDGYMFAVEGDHIALLDKTGKKVVNNVCGVCDLARLSYSNGKIIYYDGQFYGVKDLEGKILIRAKYNRLKFQSDGNLVAVNTNDKFGVINTNDDIVVPFDYDNLEYLAPDRYLTMSGNVIVLINNKGKEICDDAFDSFINRSASASEANLTSLIDANNNKANVGEEALNAMESLILNLLNLDEGLDAATMNMSGDFEFNDGNNTLHGIFTYEGADYPFNIMFTYDKQNNTVINGVYQAEGYGGGGSTNDISSMVIAPDLSSIMIEGPGLEINALRVVPGQWNGMMLRGDHMGDCKLMGN